MTPPDGTQPRMRMYVWDTATVSGRSLESTLPSLTTPDVASPTATETSKLGS